MDTVTGANNSCYSIRVHDTLFMPIVMIAEMIVGLPGNALALWIFCSCLRVWKPHTVLLFNMALADLLLLINVPFRIDAYLRKEHWVFGAAWCRTNLFLLAISRSASIAFMTTVALDRYFKVTCPHHRISRMTFTQAGWLAGLIWIFVIAVRAPLLASDLLHKHGNSSLLCRSFYSYEKSPLQVRLHSLLYIVEFILPWFLLLFCSARITCFLRKRQMHKQKKVRQAIRTVGVIFLVFTVCFMPSVVAGLGAMSMKAMKHCAFYNLIVNFFMTSIAFTYLNSTLDPVIYCFSSSVFREALKNCFVKGNSRPASQSSPIK